MTKPPLSDPPQLPPPADPINRHEALPWESAKPAEDDPHARARVETILNSASYRRADADIEFLEQYGVRGVRLQMDYLKPELLLAQHGIRQTIVVFGGTRICEPAAARRAVDELKAAVAADGTNKDAARRLASAERILAKSHYYDVAREFARLVSRASQVKNGERMTIVTGGGPGIMEAANRGAFDAGAQSVGLNISLPREQYPNPYITPDLCFQFHYFAMRKLHFLLRAKALVAFPGGFGTFDELFEVLTLIQTRKINPMPVVLVGESFWRSAVDFDFLVDEGVVDPEDRQLFWFAETAEDIWNGILHWHDASGRAWTA